MDIDSATSRIAIAEKSVTQAERDAQEKVNLTRKRVAAAQVESEKELEHNRDIYAKRSDEERARAELLFQEEKHRGYERLRDLQTTEAKELARVAREADQAVRDTTRRVDTQVFETQKRGQSKLEDSQRKNYALEQFTRRQGESQIEALKQDHEAQMMAIHFNEENVRGQALASSEARQKAIRESTQKAVAMADEHNQQLFTSELAKHHASQNRLASEAAEQLAQLRRSTSSRLDSYSSRQNDPFYKLVELKPQVSESDGSFTITAKIPEHEQGKISIRMEGNNLVLSGQRRNQEVSESAEEPGRVSRTASYQSFSESIPLGHPVNPKLLTREFQGDRLVITVPKRTYEVTDLKKRKTVEAEIVERPRFPKNLPGEKALADMAGIAAKDGKKTLG